MQITSLNSINTTINYNSKEHVNNTSFEEEINKTSKLEKEKKGLFLSYLEHTKSFEEFNPNDIKVFKSILMDNKISEEELSSLTYEQTKSFSQFIQIPFDEKNLHKIPIFDASNKTKFLISSTSWTNDENFNKATFKTYEELSFRDIFNLNTQLSFNIEQTQKGEKPTILYFTDIYNKNPKSDILEYQVDFTTLLTSIIKQSQEDLNSSTTHPDVRKQLEETNNLYSKLLDNYEQVKNESKYA